MQAGMEVTESLYLIFKQEEERVKLGLVWTFETSKPILSDTPSLARPHLLSFPKQFNPLGTKHLNL